MSNIYQQIDLLSRIQPACSSAITFAQQIMDVVNPIQDTLDSLPNISSAFLQSIPTQNLNMTGFVELYANLASISCEMGDVNGALANLNTWKLDYMTQSLSAQKAVIAGLIQPFSMIHTDKIANSATAMLQELLYSIPDSVYDTILEDEEYTRQDIEEEIASLDVEDSDYSIEGSTPDEAQEKLWKQLWEKHPQLASILVKMFVVLAVISTSREITSFLQDIVIPAAQNAIVHFQEKENSYFIKVDSARIYEEPDSHSARLTNALYGDEVYKLEDVKLWVKVSYKTTDGEKITGWIAKRNLLPYRDYEFDSDKLYE